MKNIISVFLLLISINAFAKKTKVACIGDSITWGTNIIEREKNCYPSYLQYLLGDDYEVKNFGVPGATLLNNADYPYAKLPVLPNALKFKADIYIIMLGTNDCKVKNRIHINEFEKDYKYLISRCKKANPKAEIILMIPILIPIPNGGFKKHLETKIIPVIQKVAASKKLSLIDMQTPFNLELQKQYSKVKIPDGIHPNSYGARLIAQKVFKKITTN